MKKKRISKQEKAAALAWLEQTALNMQGVYGGSLLDGKLPLERAQAEHRDWLRSCRYMLIHHEGIPRDEVDRVMRKLPGWAPSLHPKSKEKSA